MTKQDLSLFRARRTIRKFTSEDVNNEIVNQLLDIASIAPSRLDRRPLHMLIIRDQALKNKLAEAMRVRPLYNPARVAMGVLLNSTLTICWPFSNHLPERSDSG